MLLPSSIDQSFTPLMLTKRALNHLMGGRVDLVRRLLYAEDHGILASDGQPWLKTVIKGTSGRERMIDTDWCMRAYARIRAGEVPPPLPSTQRGRRETQGG